MHKIIKLNLLAAGICLANHAYALEALNEAWAARRVTMDELWRYAQICRVANVMRPYMEALGAKP